MRRKTEYDILIQVELQDNGCWSLPYHLTASGYSQVRFNGTHMVGHRLVYEALRGDIPEGKCLDHLCRNRWCCNPDHLEPVSQKENIHRGIGVAAVNRLKTHCARGHEYSLDNTAIYDGERRCCICDRERALNYYHRQRSASPEEAAGKMANRFRYGGPTCRRGHLLSGDNLYIRPDGKRQCRECKRMRARHDSDIIGVNLL